MIEVEKAATHNGQFHPDDVFSAVLLERVFPGVEIVRTRDPSVIEAAGLVFDVGREYDPSRLRFDHHQPGAPVRPNGIAYSTFGLLWMEFGEAYCGGDEDVAKAVDQRLVQVVDANDNGTSLSTPVIGSVAPFEIFDVLSQLNPLYESGEKYDEQYRKAVKLGADILERLVQAERTSLSFKEYFLEQVESSPDSRCVVINQPGDFKKIATIFEGLLYVIAPDEANDTWGATAVSRPDNVFEVKAPFPQQWAGLEPKDLSSMTGVPDAQFCHLKRFYAVAKSQAGAMRLVELALEAGSKL